jgi:outer membrane protein assembly factor BamB
VLLHPIEDQPPPSEPRVLGPGEWEEAPPVRQPSGDAAVAPPAPEGDEYTQAAAQRRRRNRRFLTVGWVVVGCLLLATLGVWFFNKWRAEERALEKAQADYNAENYSAAAGKFEQLAQEWPDSQNAPLYRFFAELSDVRAQVFPADLDPSAALARVKEFLKAHEQDPLLQEHTADVWLTLVRLREDLLKEARSKLETRLLQQTKEALELSRKYRPVNPQDEKVAAEIAKEDARIAEVRKGIQGIEEDVARAERLRKLLAFGNEIMQKRPTHERIQEFRDRAKREGFATDPEVVAKVREIEDSRLKWIVFRPHEEVLLPQAGDTDPGLLITPNLGGHHSTLKMDDRVVFALVRGVLYALRLGNGEVLWATRVGIDQTTLPIRLPQEGQVPERVLVLSSDDKSLTARDVHTGRQLWQHQLSDACLSRPLLVGKRAYIPMVNGQIDVIEIVQGHVLGTYDVGEPLVVGGARQEGTDLLYFPADSDCVYVIDVGDNPKIPFRILDTEHPSGSLRGEPIIVSPENPNVKPDPNTPRTGYLILCQTKGLDAMRLRVFPLPIEDSHTPAFQPEPEVQGWSWLTPYCDGETLLLATDEGILGIFGVKQYQNDDPPLFAAIQQDKVLPPPPPGNVDLFADVRKNLARERDATRAERAQVVRTAENFFAVLIRGELQLLHFDLFRQRVARVWPRADSDQNVQPLRLGFPLHGSQLADNGHTLIATTQLADGRTCRVTAVNMDNGTIHWQRQLGMVVQTTPLVVGRHRETPAGTVLGLLAVAPLAGMPAGLPGAFALPLAREDVALIGFGYEGGMYRFQSDQIPVRDDRDWYMDNRMLAEPIKDKIVGSVYYVQGDKFLYAVASTPVESKEHRITGYNLIVRRYEEGRRVADQFTLELPGAPLGGPPALSGNILLMTLADGNVARVAMQEGARPQPGTTIRDKWADRQRPCYIVPLGENEFLATDGSRTITRYSWPPNALVPKEEAKATLPASITAAPVIAGDELVCFATGDGAVRLLGTSDLKAVQTWSPERLGRDVWPGAKVTAGPFVREWRGKRWIGCVLDHRYLVRLDPRRDRPTWRQPYRAPEAIIGEPQIVGDVLLVADQSGHFSGRDPDTGARRGSDYTLQVSVTPASTPVTFGTGRAFVPLTDGTVMLLSMGRFK